MKTQIIFDGFYIELKDFITKGRFYMDINYYGKGMKRETALYITGSHLLMLGRFNLSVKTGTDIARLQALYKQVILWLLDECQDIEMARLYLLRGEKVLDRKMKIELSKQIRRTSMFRENIKSKINMSEAEAYAYMYRLENWINAVYGGKEKAGCVAAIEQYFGQITEELEFLAKIQEIPHFFDAEGYKYYQYMCYKIYLLLSRYYEYADMKDQAIEFLNRAIEYNQQYKQAAGRGIKGAIQAEEMLDRNKETETAVETETNDEKNIDGEGKALSEEDERRAAMEKVYELLKKLDPEFAE